MGPALAEAAWQASTEHELDLGDAYAQAMASAGEFDGLNDQLPAEDSEYEEPCIEGEGDDSIETSNNPGELGIETDIPLP
jgi:hypothetical protein